MTSPILPRAGRLCIRRNSHGSMLVGVLHFAAGVEILEGAAYLARLDQGSFALCQKLDDGLTVDRADYGVNDLMQAPIWNRTSDPRFLVVRFMHAFPEQNGWTVFGAGDQVLAVELDDTWHAWLDVAGGACSRIAAPMSTAGVTMGQILNTQAVWPGPDGNELYTVPAIPLATRHKYLELSQLGARFGGGEIRHEDYVEAIKARDDWFHVRPFGSPEMGYLRFLHDLQQAGGLRLNRPMTTAEHHAHECLVAQLVRAQH